MRNMRVVDGDTQSADELGRGAVVPVFRFFGVFVGHLRGRVRSQSGRGLRDRRSTTTDSWAGRRCLFLSWRSRTTSSVMSRALANDVRLHGDGTG